MTNRKEGELRALRAPLNRADASRALSEAGYEIVWLNGFAKFVTKAKAEPSTEVPSIGRVYDVSGERVVENHPEFPFASAYSARVESENCPQGAPQRR